MKIHNPRGFTLIELMIVIAVIGVIIAIALPNYQAYVTRTVCEDAKGVLAGAASTLERFRAQNNTYVGSDLGALGYDQSPVDGSAQFAIAPSNVTATAYLLTATPVAGSRLANRGTLTLSSAGARGATGDLATADVWNSNCRGL